MLPYAFKAWMAKILPYFYMLFFWVFGTSPHIYSIKEKILRPQFVEITAASGLDDDEARLMCQRMSVTPNPTKSVTLRLSWEANSSGQSILRTLYETRRLITVFSAARQMNPIQVLPHYFYLSIFPVL